jgi:hypothetical protein
MPSPSGMPYRALSPVVASLVCSRGRSFLRHTPISTWYADTGGYGLSRIVAISIDIERSSYLYISDCFAAFQRPISPRAQAFAGNCHWVVRFRLCMQSQDHRHSIGARWIRHRYKRFVGNEYHDVDDTLP